MKRISALFLSLLMAASVTGCGNDAVTDAVIDTVADAVIDSLEESSSSADTSGGELLYTPEAENDYVYIELPGDSSNEAAPDQSADSSYETTPDQSAGEYVETQLPVEGEYYYDLENVVLYLDTYGCLPDNYITKNEARKLGWEGGTPERFLDGAAIGGDKFGNREGLLPDGYYTECDLNTDGSNSRGAERLVFSDDGHYYHTEDHYESFTEVWVEDGEVVW